MEELLEKYFSLTEETYNLLLEENRILKTDAKEFSQEMIAQKSQLLDSLKETVQEIKAKGQSGPVEGIRSRELIGQTEKKLMKIFLLDRENQQLVLEAGFEKKKELVSDAVSLNTAKNAYSKVAEHINFE